MSEQPEKNAGTFACPRTLWGALPSLFFCATVAFIAWLMLAPAAAPPRRLWVPILVETNGTPTVLGETRQMEFWTPSAKTKDYLTLNGRVINHNERWQILPSDDTVEEFGSVLHSNYDVFGYRRVEVWGQGRTSFKPGWWWTMNVTTNYSVSNLAQIYRQYWKSPQAVMVEVIDNRGSTE